MLDLSPAPGFDDPLALLAACHDKVRHFSRLTLKIREHVASHGADAEAATAAQAVLRYFDVAAPLHHEDEELDLFPALRALGDAELSAVMAQLESEHETLGEGWQQVRAWLLQLAAGDAAHAPEVLEAFVRQYHDHAHREESQVFSAARALPADVLAQLGRSMAARRGG